MPVIVFRLKDGAETKVEAAIGDTVMNVAVNEGIRGLLADCGGSCSCATCHVYVGEAFLDLVPPISEMEEELLTGVAAERKPGSRLSCQLPINAASDGLIIEIPDRQ
jgi:2Fe-2S ferredoxin